MRCEQCGERISAGFGIWYGKKFHADCIEDFERERRAKTGEDKYVVVQTDYSKEPKIIEIPEEIRV